MYGVFRHTILCALAWLFLLLPAPTAEAQEFRRVLLLNSYNHDLLWTADVTDGVENVLSEQDVPVKVYVEFMDTKNYFSPEYLNMLVEKYRFKYTDITFDAIITSDDNAANFALEHRAELFKNAPIVFCGVNDLDYPKRSDFKNITGVLEFTDIAGTINAARMLQPGLKRVYVVIDDTTTGRISRGLVEKVIPDYEDRIEFNWIEKMSMADVKHTVANLPPDSAVLLVMYNRDIDGVWYTYRELIEHLSSVANTPIYGMWDFFMDKGIVGGMITSGRRQGSIAARMAAEIMDGKQPEEVSVVVQKSNMYLFDYAVMEQFKLDPRLLPEGVKLINVPESIFTKYAFEVWTIAILIVFLSGVIVMLLVNNRARRNAEMELEELSHYQETLIEQRTDELVHRSRELEIANYELKKLDNLKTAVMNTVSHDLRTPLTSVLGFCKIINRDFNKYFRPLYEESPELQARGERIVSNLDIVEMEGERLTRLISDFLDLSKIDSGDIVWNDVALSPVDLINQAAPVLHGYFSGPEVVLNVEMGESLPGIVADPDRLLQVINNLIGNAAKFTNAGSVTLSMTHEDGMVVFVVKDTGVGIPPDQLDSIFDKFYQVAEANADVQVTRGSGMGLTISKRIVEHYGGTITVQSELTHGSTFTFTIPEA